MMAAGRRDELAQRLMANGWPPDTPAALILGAATPSMWTWRGWLSALPDAIVPAASADAPARVVVGAVAAPLEGAALEAERIGS